MKVKVKLLSRVRLFATPWTVAYQASPSMGFSRQAYWNGLPFPSPGDLPNPGIEPESPTLQADTLPSEPLLSLLAKIKCKEGWHFWNTRSLPNQLYPHPERCCQDNPAYLTGRERKRQSDKQVTSEQLTDCCWLPLRSTVPWAWGWGGAVLSFYQHGFVF